MRICIYMSIYCIYCVYVYIYVDIYGFMYMYVCVCVYICIKSFKGNFKFQRVLHFSALLPGTSILTSSPQYTGSNTWKLHKISDHYVKL